MLSILVDFVWLALLLAALWASGDLLALAVGRRVPATLREVPAAIGLGMGVWSVLLFGLAAVDRLQGLWIRGLFWLAVAWAAWRGLGAVGRRLGSLVRPQLDALHWAAGALLAYTTAVVLLLAAAPTIGWDDAAYHLRLPALYLAHGGFRWVRFSIYSHWPQNGEMWFALAMALRGFVLAKLLHWAAGALALWVAYRAARRYVAVAPAMAVPLLLLATPSLLDVARVAYIDLFVVLFVTLAGGTMLRAHAGEERAPNLVAAGCFLGLAAGTKMTAWVAVVSFAVVWAAAAWRRREPPGPLAAQLARLAGPAIAIALPWHLKAWWETGNPVYPLAFGVFGGVEWSAALAAGTTEMFWALGRGRAPLDYLALPWRVFTAGGPSHAGFMGVLGAHWLIAIPVAVYAALRPGPARIAAAIGGLFFLLWAAGPQGVRYFLPALPLLAIASASGIDQLAQACRRQGVAILLTMAGAVALVFQLPEQTRHALAELRATSHRDRPATLRNPSPALLFLETQTAATAKVLFVNNNRVFPLTREALADSLFEASQIAEWLGTLGPVDSLQQALHDEGFTHVLLERVDWGIDWPTAFLELLGDGSRAVVTFESADRRFAVYELAPP